MDDLIGGSAFGAALVGLIWALAHAIRRRSDGSARIDEAQATSIITVATELGELRGDLKRERAEREALAKEVAELRRALDREQDVRRHWEAQTEIHRRRAEQAEQQAEEWRSRAEHLYGELARSLATAEPSTEALGPGRQPR